MDQVDLFVPKVHNVISHFDFWYEYNNLKIIHYYLSDDKISTNVLPYILWKNKWNIKSAQFYRYKYLFIFITCLAFLVVTKNILINYV